uniref:BURP domain-containing protein n=1 Tax=Kalanchoe fedtschenkoi TaxID=63787 RepID=A0A7N0TLS3_KALFE
MDTDKNEALVNTPSEKVLYAYDLGTGKNEILVNPPSMHLFLEKNLAPGTQMEMEFTRLEDVGYVFIPRQIADSILFSSDKLSTILTQLSIEPESPKAQLMNDTLKH